MDIYRPICCPKLSNALGGTEGLVNTSLGNVYYTTQGKGEPLVLIHGINAGASNYEWKNNFKKLSDYYTVYAPDLPGFGRSDKLPMSYNARAYITAINEFIINVVKKPCFILTSGLPSAYCCYIAYASNGVIKALAMITPSGLGSNSASPCESSYTTYGLFTSPVQGDGIYNAFASKQGIRYFLEEFVYSNPEQVSNNVVNYLYDSSHQCPNAKYAPASFVAGFSNLDIYPFYSQIEIPMLVLWGRLARLNPISNLNYFISMNQNAVPYVFEDSGMIPHYERTDEFNSVILEFFGQYNQI